MTRLSVTDLHEMHGQQTLPDVSRPETAEPKEPPAFKRGGEKRRNTQVPSNKYPGQCGRCGNRVEVGEGYAVKQDGRWVVFHHGSCPPPAEIKKSPEAEKPEPAPSFAKVSGEFIEGCYTVVFENGDHRTIKVQRQDEHDDFLPGKMIMSFLSGPDNWTNYTSFAHVDEHGNVRVWKKHRHAHELIEAIKVMVGDPLAAVRAYGLRSGMCGVCGRKLTNPESIEAGIGPICASRLA